MGNSILLSLLPDLLGCKQAASWCYRQGVVAPCLSCHYRLSPESWAKVNLSTLSCLYQALCQGDKKASGRPPLFLLCWYRWLCLTKDLKCSTLQCCWREIQDFLPTMEAPVKRMGQHRKTHLSLCTIPQYSLMPFKLKAPLGWALG